jgi:circadian clock protein KaiC
MVKTERVTTGIAGLDQLLEGGFPEGRSILVTGEPGTGKTIFALQFLVEGLRRGEKGIYVAADEGPTDIIEQGASLGWDLEKYIEAKDLAILNAGTYLSSSPGTGKERQIDIHKAIGDLAGFVNRLGAKRLVLDPAGPFVLLRDTHPGSDSLADQVIANIDANNQHSHLLRRATNWRTDSAWNRGIPRCRRYYSGDRLE